MNRSYSQGCWSHTPRTEESMAGPGRHFYSFRMCVSSPTWKFEPASLAAARLCCSHPCNPWTINPKADPLSRQLRRHSCGLQGTPTDCDSHLRLC